MRMCVSPHTLDLALCVLSLITLDFGITNGPGGGPRISQAIVPSINLGSGSPLLSNNRVNCFVKTCPIGGARELGQDLLFI